MSNRFKPPSAQELQDRGLDKNGNPLKVTTKTGVRARNEDGTLKADDPSTPDVNEAWEKAPAKKPAKKATKRGRPAKKKD